MNRKTVFLTGAGGAAVPGLIKLLKQKGYRVLAGDMSDSAAGLYIADKGFILPNGLSPDFLPAVRKICRDERVDVMIPLVDEELLTAIELEKENVPVLLPEKPFISMCLDKYDLMKELKAHHISIPKTKLASEGYEGLSFPMIAKPRVGRGSRGVQLLHSKTDYDDYMGNVSSPDSVILQEYIDGEEFTVSVAVWRDGQTMGIIPKEIIQKEKITKIAVTRKNSKVNRICTQVQEQLNANGPFNVQLRLDRNGEPKIFEINPRFSTSISLTIASGFDELNIILDQALEGQANVYPKEWKEGMILLRQTVDEFVTEEDFQERKKEMMKNKYGG